MKSRRAARIIGTGSYLPSKILTNQALEQMVETNDEWIVSRTGMRERRLAGDNEFASDMGAIAAKQALDAAGKTSADVDMILVTTMSPDYISPSTANLIQAMIQADKAAAMDLQAACTGFLYGLSTAKAFVESGMYQCVLVVAAEKMSAFIDYQDRNTCVLFGDGAGAAVVSSKGDGLEIESVCLQSDGDLAHLMMIPAGGARQPASHETVDQRKHFFTMSGNEVFKHAVRRMVSACQECLVKSKLEQADISWLVPHQANKRIMDAIAKQFQLSEQRVYQTVHKYGNTSASSIAIALHELLSQHQIQPGEHILLPAAGAGFNFGAILLTQVKDLHD